MNTELVPAVEIAKMLFDFLGENIAWFILVGSLSIFRQEIAGLVQRITKAHFSYAGASGGVEAVPPEATQNNESKTKAEQRMYVPETSEIESEAKEKEGTSGDWFQHVRDALNAGEVDTATKIFEAHQIEMQDADYRHDDEALFLYLLYIDGNVNTALPRLEELHARSSNDKQRASSALWLSLSYDAIKDYDKAVRLWQGAISKTVDTVLKTNFTIKLAQTYKNKGECKLGISLLEERLLEENAQEGRADLYHTLSILEKENGNQEAAAIALEKAVELNPGNREVLFEAAYEQSQNKFDLLSIFNYSTLLNLNPKHSTALNNLGVCAGKFKLKGKQVSLYRQAMDENMTLAMANLAELLTESGFWYQAKEILDKAIAMEEPHENVSNALYRLQTVQRQEDEKWASLSKKADAFKTQIRKYGDAYFDKTGADLNCSGDWYTKAGAEVRIDIDKGLISGIWTESMSRLSATDVYKCSVTGVRRNRSASLIYKKRAESANRNASILGRALEESIECYSYISADGQTWEIFSIDTEKEFLLKLHRTNIG